MVQSLSHVQLFAASCAAGCQASLSFTTSQSLLRLTSIESVIPSNHLILCHAFFSFIFSQHQDLFQLSWLFAVSGESIGTSASTSVLPMNIQSWFFRIDWFDLLAVQETQESPPTPQFKSISSSELSILYGPTLTSVHDHWKNHIFDNMDLCWQSDVSAFNIMYIKSIFTV